MPQNHLSYSGVIATLSTLVLAACSSSPTPEECKLAQVRAENHTVFGENYPREIDLHELARQVVFLEQEREQLLFENHILQEKVRRREEVAMQFHLLPVDIAYYRAFAQPGDIIHIRSLDHPELPVFAFCTRGPRFWSDFNQHSLYYEELPIYLPCGEYQVEVFNQGVLRFVGTRSAVITSPPTRTTIRGPDGKRVVICPANSTIFLLANGYRLE